MKNRVRSGFSLVCVPVITACLSAYMQHTLEQEGLPCPVVVREPTHWSQATDFGSALSEGRARWPWQGPEEESRRSYSMLVTTSGITP